MRAGTLHSMGMLIKERSITEDDVSFNIDENKAAELNIEACGLMFEIYENDCGYIHNMV